ncbi:hypothetical protein ACQP60_04300 [Isoptericola variabilis]|uniref:hypothetical protein n=1 Tax=Isoptericola variabilis TaxID=139208 RepID=UPI003D205274
MKTRIGRPKVTMQPVNPDDPRGLWTASCAHCDWTATSVKSYLSGTEMPYHRRKHRDGQIEVTR